MFALNGTALFKQPQYAGKLRSQFAVDLDFVVTPADFVINNRVTSRPMPPLRRPIKDGWGSVVRANYNAHPKEAGFARFTIAGISTATNRSRFYGRQIWANGLSDLTLYGSTGGISAFVYDGANKYVTGGTPVEGQPFTYVMVLDGTNLTLRTSLATPGSTVTGGYTSSGGNATLGNILGQPDSSESDCQTLFTALLLRQYRPWSVAEQNEFLLNPWHIFQSPTRRIFLPSSASGTLYFQNIAGSLTGSGIVTRNISFGKTVTGSIAGAGIVNKMTSRGLAGGVTGSGSPFKTSSKVVQGSVAGTGALSASTGAEMSLTGSITASGIVSRSVQFLRSYSSAITMAGNVSKRTARSVFGTIQAIGTMGKGMFVSLAGSITASGILSSLKFTPTVGTFVTSSLRSIRKFIGRR